MKLGMIGLGRMGANPAQRLMHGGHELVGFDPKPEARGHLEDKGAEPADSLVTLVSTTSPARALADGTRR